jgi:hypothetical protein
MSDSISQFKALKLHGMAECYAEIQAQGQAGSAEAIASAALVTQPFTGRRSH